MLKKDDGCLLIFHKLENITRLTIEIQIYNPLKMNKKA
jgi:hypothetical protein